MLLHGYPFLSLFPSHVILYFPPILPLGSLLRLEAMSPIISIWGGLQKWFGVSLLIETPNLMSMWRKDVLPTWLSATSHVFSIPQVFPCCNQCRLECKWRWVNLFYWLEEDCFQFLQEPRRLSFVLFIVFDC